MGPSNRDEGKMGICDIVFIILLVLMLLFLIPFYSSILDILKLASQFMVGADTYIGLLGFILGFFMGKIIVKRSIDISFLLCLIYALISFGLMLLIGSLKYVFYDYMYSNFTFTFSISLNH